MTRNAFAKGERVEFFSTWPDFVIKTARELLQENKLDDKYRQKFLQIIEEAEKCKVELGIKSETK